MHYQVLKERRYMSKLVPISRRLLIAQLGILRDEFMKL